MAFTNGNVMQTLSVDLPKFSKSDENCAEKSSCPGVDKLLQIYDSPKQLAKWLEERNGKSEFDVDEVVKFFNIGEKGGQWLKANKFDPEEDDPILILGFQFPRFYQLNGNDLLFADRDRGERNVQMVVEKLVDNGAVKVDGTDFTFFFRKYQMLNEAKEALKRDLTFRWAYYYNNDRQVTPLPPGDVRLIPTIKSVVLSSVSETRYAFSNEGQFFEL